MEEVGGEVAGKEEGEVEAGRAIRAVSVVQHATGSAF
jgi:hypothetical protein